MSYYLVVILVEHVGPQDFECPEQLAARQMRTFLSDDYLHSWERQSIKEHLHRHFKNLYVYVIGDFMIQGEKSLSIFGK
jgi:hypothetical protein